MSTAIGISLGSKQIIAATMVGGNPKIVASMLAVIGISADGSMLVGDRAAYIKLKEPQHAISDILRYIGRDPADEQLQHEAAEAGVTLAECDGQIGFLIRGKVHSATQLLTGLFEALKQECESKLSEAVVQCVVTHPTNYRMRQIGVINQSAEDAGLQPVRIVNELFAIGLSYGLDEKNRHNNTLIYHLGNSLSAGVLREGSLEIIAHTGDAEIGGGSFDRAIMDRIVSQVRIQHGIDLPATLAWPQIRQGLIIKAESAKIALSRSEQTVIRQDLLIEPGKHLMLDLELSRREFEAMIELVISNSLVRVNNLLLACRDRYLIDRGDIDQVLLSGGSCQIPCVQQALKDEFGYLLCMEYPHLTARRAIGAALAIEPAPTFDENERSEIPSISLCVMLNHSIGIALDDGSMHILLPIATKLPASSSIEVKTNQPNQTYIHLQVYEGEDRLATENTYLGEAGFDIPPGLAAGTPVMISLSVDASYEFQISAILPDSGSHLEQSGLEHKSHPVSGVPSELAAGYAAAYPVLGEDWHQQVETQLACLGMALNEAGDAIPSSEYHRLEELGNSLQQISHIGGSSLSPESQGGGDREKSLRMAAEIENGLKPYQLFLSLGFARLLAQRTVESGDRRLGAQLKESLAKADEYKRANDYQRFSECVQAQVLPLAEKIIQALPTAVIGQTVMALPHTIEQPAVEDEWSMARSLFEEGNLDGAEQFIRQALKADPNQNQLKDLLVEITKSRVEHLLEQGFKGQPSPEEAMKLVDRAVELLRDADRIVGPNHPYLDIRSLIEMRQQLVVSRVVDNGNQAIENANRAIQDYQPGANYHATISQLDTALHDLEAANRAAPQEELTKFIHDLREVRARISISEASFLNARAVEMSNEAVTAMQHQRNYEAAIKLRDALGFLEQARQIEPSNTTIGDNLAQAKKFLRLTGFEYLAPAYVQTVSGVRSDLPTPHISPPPPRPPPARTGSPEMPASRVDQVHFTITAPPEVIPGESFVLDVWAHLQKQRKEVILRAQQALGGGEVLVQSVGPVQITRGTVLRARLQIEGCQVGDPENTILWQGEIGSATFAVIVPKGLRTGALLGKVFIYADVIQIVRIDFRLKVGKRQRAPEALSIRQVRHRKAFASYAHEDTDAVLARIQGMQKVIADLEFFFDVMTLRSGQNWEKELWKVIPRCDIFYLFWSAYAKSSSWVEKEWRCALEKRGLDFIDPVPLVHPDQAQPPPELAGKHFNDWVLAFQRGQS